jgi:hypothetical protein
MSLSFVLLLKKKIIVRNVANSELVKSKIVTFFYSKLQLYIIILDCKSSEKGFFFEAFHKLANKKLFYNCRTLILHSLRYYSLYIYADESRTYLIMSSRCISFVSFKSTKGDF